MLKYLRMDVYRLLKDNTLYITFGIILALSVFSVFMMSTMASLDRSGAAIISAGGTDASPPTSMVGQNGMELASLTQIQTGLWVSTAAVIVSVVVALLFSLDFSSGYVKNLPLSRRDRLAYYGSKIVLVVALSAVFLAFGIVMFEVLRVAAGFTYARMDSVAEIAVWFGLSLVVISTYGILTALVTWLTQSKGAGIVAALVIGSSIAEQVLIMALSNLSVAWELLARVAEWLPISNYALLTQGGEALLASPGDVSHVLITCGVAFVVCVALSLGVCSRKDV